MDKAILNVEDIEKLLAWRDGHQAEVRSAPAPLRAIEIIMPHNGYFIKGIRAGNTLRLHLRQNHRQLGNCIFERRHDGMWAAIKNRMLVSNDDVQSMLTVYCSLMALMAYSVNDRCHAESAEAPLPRTKSSSTASCRKSKRLTYIIKGSGGTIRAAVRGSRSSPSGEFSVRGHYRHYRSGKVIWIDEYRKGSGKKKSKTYKVGGEKNGHPD